MVEAKWTAGRKFSSRFAMTQLFIRLRTFYNSMDVAHLRYFLPAVSTTILLLTNHMIGSCWVDVHFSITPSNDNPKARCCASFSSQPPAPVSFVWMPIFSIVTSNVPSYSHEVDLLWTDIASGVVLKILPKLSSRTSIIRIVSHPVSLMNCEENWLLVVMFQPSGYASRFLLQIAALSSN